MKFFVEDQLNVAHDLFPSSKFQSTLPPNTYYVFTSDRYVTVKKLVPEVVDFINKGYFQPAPVFELFVYRAHMMLSTLLILASNFNLDVRGVNENYTRLVNGCFQCHRHTRPDKGKLLKCAHCASVYYCSRDCQRAHWKEHKRDCDDMRRENERWKRGEQRPPEDKGEEAKKDEARAGDDVD
jgi:hypothetical protein